VFLFGFKWNKFTNERVLDNGSHNAILKNNSLSSNGIIESWRSWDNTTHNVGCKTVNFDIFTTTARRTWWCIFRTYTRTRSKKKTGKWQRVRTKKKQKQEKKRTTQLDVEEWEARRMSGGVDNSFGESRFDLIFSKRWVADLEGVSRFRNKPEPTGDLLLSDSVDNTGDDPRLATLTIHNQTEEEEEDC
jgi:hypothetical protein